MHEANYIATSPIEQQQGKGKGKLARQATSTWHRAALALILLLAILLRILPPWSEQIWRYHDQR